MLFKEFSISHANPVDFFISQWQSTTKSSVYVTYRWIVALIFIGFVAGWFIGDFINRTGIIIDAIFMTNISFVLSTVTMSLSAYLAYSYYKSDVKPADEMTWILKVFWIMSTTSPTIAVAVSLNYWIFVYTPEHFQIDFNNVMSHIMNAVIPLIDVWIIKQPGMFKMCIFPTLFVHMAVPSTRWNE